ncbi:MAG: mechanosensitive ion channel family protein [Gemmatimonadota bacterium]
MQADWLDKYSAWLIPAALVLAGLLFGVLVERILIARLRRVARRTAWAWDDFLLQALGHAPLLLFTAAGAYAAARAALPEGVSRGFLNKTLAVLVLLAATTVAARATSIGARGWLRRSTTSLPASSLITNLVQFLVYLLGGLVILQTIDVEITPIITGLGIGGLAVALALQPTLANVFSGFQILAARQVRTGDYIRLDSGEEGYVTDVRWRNTVIKGLFEDHEVVVPNSKLADSIVTNYDLPRRVIWTRCDVGVHYESDLEQVEEVTLEVAREVVRVAGGEVHGLEPVLRFHTFGASSVDMTVRLPVEEFAMQYRLRHEFVKRLHRRYREAGITIPYPIRTLELPPEIRVRTIED